MEGNMSNKYVHIRLYVALRFSNETALQKEKKINKKVQKYINNGFNHKIHNSINIYILKKKTYPLFYILYSDRNSNLITFYIS